MVAARTETERVLILLPMRVTWRGAEREEAHHYQFHTMWFDVKLCHCVFFTGTGKTAIVRKPVK